MEGRRVKKGKAHFNAARLLDEMPRGNFILQRTSAKGGKEEPQGGERRSRASSTSNPEVLREFPATPTGSGTGRNSLKKKRGKKRDVVRREEEVDAQ